MAQSLSTLLVMRCQFNIKSGIITEHNMTRNKSGIFDVSHMGQLFIKDNDDLTEDLQKIFPLI